MDRTCYNAAECKICGCDVPNLQMANKPCEGNCYPAMMNKRGWDAFKHVGDLWSKDIYYQQGWFKFIKSHVEK